MNRNTLSIREWMTACLLSFSILLIISLAYCQSYRFPKKYLKSYPIAVSVSGAVKYPGIYQLYPGITIEKVLQKAKLLDEADQNELNFDKMLFQSEGIFVPFLKKITIKIMGAVEEKIIELKPGSRLSSIKKLVVFKENADISVLNSQKKLKDGQVVFIPNM